MSSGAALRKRGDTRARRARRLNHSESGLTAALRARFFSRPLRDAQCAGTRRALGCVVEQDRRCQHDHVDVTDVGGGSNRDLHPDVRQVDVDQPVLSCGAAALARSDGGATCGERVTSRRSILEIGSEHAVTVTSQMFAAIAIGTWTMTSSTLTLTRPDWLVCAIAPVAEASAMVHAKATPW